MNRLTFGLPVRLTLFVVAPLLLTLGVGGTLVLRGLEQAFERRMKKEVQMVARALQLPLSHAMEREHTHHIERALESAINIGGVYGAYVYDSTGDIAGSIGRAQSSRDQRQISRVIDKGRRSGTYNEVAGRSVYSYFVPLSASGGRIVGLLQVTRRASDIATYMQRVRHLGLWILLGSALLMTFIVWVGYEGAVGRSLARLRRSMARVQDGDRHHRADRGGPREIDGVSRTLNDMLDSIARAQQRLRDEQDSRIHLESQLRHAEKLAAIGRLATGVAHELGTPLSVIDGRCQRALRDASLPLATQSALQGIRHEVQRVARIVRQLLDFGRTESGQRARLELAPVVENVRLALVDEAQQRCIEVKVERGSTLYVHVDPVRLEQALTNLVKNAIQAARARVSISYHVEEGGHVQVLVDDDGPGLAPEAEMRLFEPFFTTKPVDEGTGLGLAIAYAVSQEHGGSLEAGSSATLGGARFCMRLPKVPAAHDSSGGSDPGAEVASHQTQRVGASRA